MWRATRRQLGKENRTIMTTTILVDAAGTHRPVRRAWETAVGSGDAWSLLRADLQAQLRRAVRDCGFRYLRCHGILCDQLQVVRRDRHGALVYNWQLVDKVYDALLHVGLRPFVELGFMPAALAGGDQTIFHYRANVTPPADYVAWNGFIHALIAHWRDRYGADELRQWYFEVWNEPNLASFWAGTQADYFRLYAETARTIKGVDPALRVGGPATTRGEWITPFLAYCRAHNAPLDVISTHVYPDDEDFAKVDPDYRAVFARGAYLERVVDRVADEVAGEARVGTAGRLETHWTEWSASWRWGDPTHDAANLAAYICRVARHVDDRVDSFAFWTISDIFNEFPYPRAALVDGFGLLTIDGLPKPGYHAYTLLHHLGDEQLPVTLPQDEENETTRLDCWATASEAGYQLLLSSYVPPGAGVAAPAGGANGREVTVRLQGLAEDGAGPLRLVEYRVDAAHANVSAAWAALGRPATPTREQVAELRAASELCPQARGVVAPDESGILTVTSTLTPGAVVLLEVARTP